MMSSARKAREAGIASPIAGKVSNPRGQGERWDLLHRAAAFSRPAALESVSWGIGQIMGAHWKALGFGSVEEMVELARSGAAGQVRLLILFLEKNGLVPLLERPRLGRLRPTLQRSRLPALRL